MLYNRLKSDSTQSFKLSSILGFCNLLIDLCLMPADFHLINRLMIFSNFNQLKLLLFLYFILSHLSLRSHLLVKISIMLGRLGQSRHSRTSSLYSVAGPLNSLLLRHSDPFSNFKPPDLLSLSLSLLLQLQLFLSLLHFFLVLLFCKLEPQILLLTHLLLVSKYLLESHVKSLLMFFIQPDWCELFVQLFTLFDICKVISN